MRTERGPTIGFRMPTREGHQALKLIAEKEGRTVSSLVARFVTRCVAAYNGTIGEPVETQKSGRKSV